MKQRLLLLLTFAVSACALLGQGIEFEKGSWDDVLEKAKASDRMIFVDGYAEWCGPCKRLARDVFPKKDVGDFFNANFVNVKMDMEKGDGLKFRKKYPVSAFPTLYFIAPDGKLVQSTKGAPRTTAALIDLGNKAIGKFDRSENYRIKYDAGDRSYETMYNLVKTLNKSGKPSLKYANEYLRGQDDMETEENLKFLFEAMTQVDSRLFDLFVRKKESLKAYFSEEEIKNKITQAADKTVANAIEFSYPELLTEAQDKFASVYPKHAKAYKSSSELDYAIGVKDGELFLANTKNVTNVEEQRGYIHVILNNFHENEKAIKLAEKWAKAHVKRDKNAASNYVLAMIYVKQENIPQAIKSLEACLALTSPDTREYKIYNDHLKKLKSTTQ